MPKRLIAATASLTILFAGCDSMPSMTAGDGGLSPTNPGGRSASLGDSALGPGDVPGALDLPPEDVPPQKWMQHQGGSMHQGTSRRETALAIADNLKWEFYVGDVSFSAPVVGANGDVYVGNKFGEFVAVSKYGKERWRFAQGAATFRSTAAVSESGLIFVLKHVPVSPGSQDPRTVLECYTPEGERLWSRPAGNRLDAFTSASITVFDDYSFVLTESEGMTLYVFDVNGDQVTSASTTGSSPVCGGSNFLSGLWDVLTTFPCCAFDKSVSVDPVIVTPTVALVDDPDLMPNGWPIVVIANHLYVQAFEFRRQELNFIWEYRIWGGGCDDDPVPHGSPSITPDGQVIIGNDRGRIRSLDLFTGDLLWEKNLDGQAVSTPAIAGNRVYMVAWTRLHIFDLDGALIRSINLPELTQASALVSANHVHITSWSGLLTYDRDFAATNTKDSLARSRVASAAIGDDGTLYVATSDGWLRAYGGNPVPPYIDGLPDGFGLENTP